MPKELGLKIICDGMKTSFVNPSIPSQNVYALLDVCHMLKLVRNCFATCELLKNRDGGIIKWLYIDQLQKLQHDEGLHLANKLRKAKLQWQSQKKKVNLATPTLSSSVADAMEFCSQDIKIAAFNNSQATCKFIRMFDHLFDILILYWQRTTMPIVACQ